MTFPRFGKDSRVYTLKYTNSEKFSFTKSDRKKETNHREQYQNQLRFIEI